MSLYIMRLVFAPNKGAKTCETCEIIFYTDKDFSPDQMVTYCRDRFSSYFDPNVGGTARILEIEPVKLGAVRRVTGQLPKAIYEGLPK